MPFQHKNTHFKIDQHFILLARKYALNQPIGKRRFDF